MHAGAYRRTANTCRKKAKSRNILPDRKFYQTVGAGLRARPQSLILADFGRTRLFSVPSKSRDLLCASAHRGTPGEGSPRQNSPPDCFVSPPALLQGKEFRSVRGATKGFTFGFHRLFKGGRNFTFGQTVCKDIPLFLPDRKFQLSLQ